jgi:hypothetical protein
MVPGTPLVRAQDGAKEPPPVVVSFSGYGELKRDLESLGALSGNADVGTDFEQLLSHLTHGQGLAEVDDDRPWGGFLRATGDGSQFAAVAFLPVADLSKLLAAWTSAGGEASDKGNGVYEIKYGAKAYFVAQKENWVYLARQNSALEDLSGDPLDELGGLNEQYDLAMGVNVQSIPEALRGMAVAAIKQRLQAHLAQAPHNGAPSERITRNQIDHALNNVNQLDRVIAGLKIDRPKGPTCIDLEITALPGSDAAQDLAACSAGAAGSRLAGVFSPDAGFSLHINWLLSAVDKELAGACLKSLRGHVLVELDNDEELADEPKKEVKELVDKFFDVLNATARKAGRINFGAVASTSRDDGAFGEIVHKMLKEALPGNYIQETVIGAGEVTLVAGGLVADGAALEEWAKQIVAMATKDGWLKGPKFDIDKYQGRQFHAFTVPLPATMRADLPLRTLRNLLGNPMKIVLAFGDDTFYAAAGEHGAEAIKRLIDRSVEAPAAKLPPASVSLALGPVWDIFGMYKPDRKTENIAARGDDDDQNRIDFTIEPVDNGLRCRFEVEEGVDMLLGAAVKIIIRNVNRILKARGQ